MAGAASRLPWRAGLKGRQRRRAVVDNVLRRKQRPVLADHTGAEHAFTADHHCFRNHADLAIVPG